MTWEMIGLVIWVLFTHWWSDFVCQTDAMAKNKSTSNIYLSAHVMALMAVWSFFFVGILVDFGLGVYASFILINGGLHWLVDWITSRWVSYYHKKDEIHEMFVIIGFDQFLHISCYLIVGHWLGIFG